MEPKSIERTEHYCYLPEGGSCGSCVMIKGHGDLEFFVCFEHRRAVSAEYRCNGAVFTYPCMRPEWCDK